MKGELQSQIPALKKDFLYFADYAGKPIDKIFTEEQLKGVNVLEVKETRSALFRNDGKGNFTIEAFPQMAQLSYVFGAYVGDLNDDQNERCVPCRKFLRTETTGGTIRRELRGYSIS